MDPARPEANPERAARTPADGLRVQLLGTGDAFGSGGRLQTCFHAAAEVSVLIDCGASALSAMRRYAVDPGDVDVIVLTHLHGDHFGGVPFLLRETQIAGGRTRPLTVVGPAGHRMAVESATELLFPGAAGRSSFELEYVEYREGRTVRVGAVEIAALPVVHTPGTNPHAVRVTMAGRALVYSGDTEWTEGLPDFAAGSDLFICEAYRVDPVRNHMDYRTLSANAHRLRCRRLVLTHMAGEMLVLDEPDVPERAFDGMALAV